MRNKALHLNAFTILEVVLTLVITSIIIAFVYQIYTTISLQFKQYSENQSAVVNYNQFCTVFTRDISLCQKIEDVTNNTIQLQFPETEVTYTFEKQYAVRKGVLSDTFNISIKDVVWNRLTEGSITSNETINLNTDILGRAVIIFEKKAVDLATLINREFIVSINLSTYNKKEQLVNKREANGVAGLFKKEITFSKGFGDKDKMYFYKELSGLLTAGVDFKRALEILGEQQKKEKHKELIGTITKEVVSGKALYEALRDSDYFSAYEYYSVKIGEETRNLSAVLPELHQYFERKIQMRRQIISVFTYPAFVLLLTFGVLYFMMKFVVPMFATVFAQFDKELPELTKKIIFVSSNFSTISLVLLGIGLSLVAFHWYSRHKIFYRKATSKIVVRIPFIGHLIKKIYITRFSQSLSLLLTAKTPIVTALELVQKMISFYPIESSLSEIRHDVTRGTLFSKALEKHPIFDYKLISLVNVAEQTNTLDVMFERLAKQYDEETQHQTKMIGVVMEPLIIIIIGLVVGTVLIAMYSPMFDLSKILQTG